jgi:hypothetical protein
MDTHDMYELFVIHARQLNMTPSFLRSTRSSGIPTTVGVDLNSDKGPEFSLKQDCLTSGNTMTVPVISALFVRVARQQLRDNNSSENSCASLVVLAHVSRYVPIQACEACGSLVTAPTSTVLSKSATVRTLGDAMTAKTDQPMLFTGPPSAASWLPRTYAASA